MKISYNWLKELLAIDQTPLELAEILTNTGLEVEHVEPFSIVPGGLKGLVVGEVITKEKHPNADKLSVATVDIGEEQNLNIVCGASNLGIGQKVVVATVGTTIHPINGEGFTIKKAKLRGEPSEGMICAEDEIGLGTSHEGIMVLGNETQVGTLLSTLYNIDEDFVFEIGLTPNRTDAMGHIGVAIDIAAALNVFGDDKLTVKHPTVDVKTKGNTLKASIKVENSTACPRYAGVIIENLQIKESPDWLKHRLLSIGVRPINNVVDISNYVLKEYGQALHAFDWEQVKGDTIIVKNLTEGSKFVSLDEVERKLYAEDLMICNTTDPMCMAGVFGGIKSGVTDQTHSIFLESAYFESGAIRKTSTRHGLRTDAAQRYEKGADPSIAMIALRRAVQLIEEIAGGRVASDWYDEYPEEIKKKEISLRLQKLNSLSGHKFEMGLVKQILIDLEFEVIDEDVDRLSLLAPLSRADVLREIDVIEEVMRIYGFNNIQTPPTVRSTLSFHQGIDEQQLKERIAHTLNGFGFSEIMTNSISQSKFYPEGEKLVKLQNSMTSELDSMRASLIPEALQVLRHNINRKQANLKFYEFGNIYHIDHSQDAQLALYYTGEVTHNNWISPKQTTSIFHLKGIAEAIFGNLKLTGKWVSSDDSSVYFQKNKDILVDIRPVDRDQLSVFEIEQEIFVAVFHWNKIMSVLNKQKIRFEEQSKFPEVNRDLAVILDDEIEFEAVKNKITQHAGSLLKGLDLFDIFKSKEKIGAGKKSYAINFKLQDKMKTLTDEEIDATMNKIITTLEKNFNAIIRK
jgi:phenylalanyl-tRNA synthetase beta chain